EVRGNVGVDSLSRSHQSRLSWWFSRRRRAPLPAGGGRGGLFGMGRCPSSLKGTRANLSRVAAARWSPLHRHGWRGVMLMTPLSAPTGKRGGRDASPSTASQISRPSGETSLPSYCHHRDLDRERCRLLPGSAGASVGRGGVGAARKRVILGPYRSDGAVRACASATFFRAVPRT